MNSAPYPITLRQLQYLVAIAEAKSFRKAAQVCHVAQPSLSAQVAQVEEALDLRIFERVQKEVSLTHAGRALLERARSVLLAADELFEIARQYRDPFAGALRLGIIPTIGPYLLPEVAPILRAQYPNIAFRWVEDRTAALMTRLLAGELDGAILALEADIGELPRIVLGKDPFVFAAAPGHRLARSQKPIKSEELDGEPVLLLDDGHCFREQALSFCGRVGAEEVSYRATSLATLVQMVAGGGFVTLLPSLALPVENRHQTLRIRRFARRPPLRTLALVYRKRSALELTLKPVGQTLQSACAALLGDS